MLNRKAFNFYKSYYEVANELPEQDRNEFVWAIVSAEFTGELVEPKSKLARLMFLGQKHSILKQLEGYKSATKDTKQLPTEGPPEGPAQQVQEQGQEQVQGQEQIAQKHKFEDVKHLSSQIALAYSKKYDRDVGGQIGQDIDYLSQVLLSKMTKMAAMDQIRNHVLYTKSKKLTVPSRLETIQEALLETDWTQKMKDFNQEETINEQTNESIRATTRRARQPEIPAAFDGRIDSE